jgi:putative hydrolase of the HAD superfamily
VTIASLARAAKPAPHIFEIALEKHAVDPDEALHVGDSVRDDVEGATKAGLTGVLLDRVGRSQASGGHVIRTLEGLFPLVIASKE